MEHNRSVYKMTPIETNAPSDLHETKDYKEMRFLLAIGHEDEFVERFRACEEHDFHNVDFIMDNDKFTDLLTACMFNRAPKALNVLLNSRYIGKDFNSEALIHFAVFHNFNVPLESLLCHPTVQYRRGDILRDCMCGDYTEETLKLLMERTGVDVNAHYDDGNTLLSHAVKFREWKNVAYLLRNGAFLTSLTSMDAVDCEKLLTEIPAYVLEEHFDDCIEKIDCPIPKTKLDFIIAMKFDGLILKGNAAMDRHRNIGNDEQQEHALTAQPTQVADELAVIAGLASSKDHRYLLQHPLIESFIYLKWRLMSRVFYMNLISHIIFALTIVAFILLKYQDSQNQAATDAFKISAWIGVAYVIARELVQFILLPRRYVRSPINYVEMTLIVLSMTALLSECERVVDAFTILLVGFESCLLLGSVPAIATHMQMLREVSTTFIRFSVLYSALILTFSLCFYVLFGGASVNTSNTDANNITNNRFANPILAFLWTIVMLTGDFDSGNMNFVSPYSYVIFILFVVFMAIVLINLLNGLAVSDTQTIKNEAQVYALISRCSILCHYENCRNHSKILKIILNHKFVRTICGVINKETPREIIAPLNNGIITRKLIDLLIGCLNENQKCMPLPPHIVRSTLLVIEKKRSIKTRNRLQEMENKLKKMDEKFDEKLNEMKCTLEGILRNVSSPKKN